MEAHTRTHTHAFLSSNLFNFALDCLFHAIGFLILGDQPSPAEVLTLRATAVRSMREFYSTPAARAAFSEGQGEAVDAYTARMEKPRVWADHVLAFFLARALGVRCKMWTLTRDFELRGAEPDAQGTRTINVAFVNIEGYGGANHFEPVFEAAEEAENWSADKVTNGGGYTAQRVLSEW
jgi:hypothetical protein